MFRNNGMSNRDIPVSFAVFLFAVIFASNAVACSVCGCGDPLSAAGSAPPMAGQLRLAVDGEYLFATALGDNPGTTEFLDQETVRATLVYSATSSLSLVLQVPFARKDWWTNDPADAPLLATTNIGFGDLDLGGRWFFWKYLNLEDKRAQNLALSAGSSIPTGNSNITVDGELIDQHAELGTGAVGPYVGLLYGYIVGNLSLSLNATYRYRGTNYQGYAFGQAVSYGLGGQYRVGGSGFALTLGLDGRYADFDHDYTAVGNIDPDTGGTVLDLSPGFGWQLGYGIGVNGKVQIPVYTDLFGIQEVSPTTDLSLQYLFNP